MPPWNAAKAKVQLRLATQRLKTLQEKKEAQAKVSRRDIATLLERNKVETARIRTEALISDDIHLELLEVLELYCELLTARFGMLDQNTREPDPSVAEATCGVIFAAQRTELKELHILRDLLMHKYGRDFSAAVMDNVDNRVSDRITKKVAVITPSPELVDAYLVEIAKGYSLPWRPANENAEEGVPEAAATALSDEKSSATTDPEEAQAKSESHSATEDKPVPPAEEAPVDAFEALKKRFDALKKR